LKQTIKINKYIKNKNNIKNNWFFYNEILHFVIFCEIIYKTFQKKNQIYWKNINIISNFYSKNVALYNIVII